MNVPAEPWPGFDEIVERLGAGDLDMAINHVQRALQRAEPDAPRFQMLMMCGRLLDARGDIPAAIACFDAALDIAVTMEERGAALLARGEAALGSGAPEQARDDLSEALTLVEDLISRALAEQLLGRIEREHGDLRESIAHLSRAVAALSGPDGDARLAADATLDLALALRMAGEAAVARTMLEALLVWAGDQPDWQGRVLLQLGTTHAFEGRFDLALQRFDRALEIESDPLVIARLRYNRAVALRELGELGRAEADLVAVLAANLDDEPILAHDARIMAAVVARERGEATRAVDLLRAAIDGAPDDGLQGGARLELGTTLAMSGLFGPAVNEFTVALALLSRRADQALALRYRAMAHNEMGLPALALEDFQRAVELTDDPDDHARGLLTCAALLVDAGRKDAAWEQISRIEPARLSDPAVVAQYRFQHGSLAVDRGDLDIALAEFDRAERWAANAGDELLAARVRLNRGVALDLAGRSDEALETFAMVGRGSPDSALAWQAWMNHARLLASLGRQSDSLASFGRAALADDARETRAGAFLERGNTAMSWGRYIDADADFTRVLALEPSDPLQTQARYLRGLTRSMLGQLEQARDDLTLTIESSRDRDHRAQALLERGLVALAAGDFSSAAADLREAGESFRRRSDRALALAHLAALHAQQEDCGTAVEHLQAAMALDPAGEAATFARYDARLARCRLHPGYPPGLLDTR